MIKQAPPRLEPTPIAFGWDDDDEDYEEWEDWDDEDGDEGDEEE